MSKQRGNSTEPKGARPIYDTVQDRNGKTTSINPPSEQGGTSESVDWRVLAAIDDRSAMDFTTGVDSSRRLRETTSEHPTPISEETQQPYQPVLPYGEIAKLVRRYKQIMPKSTHNNLDELAEALEYAAKEVKDYQSECSNHASVDTSLGRVLKDTQDLHPRKTDFVDLFAGQMADTFDVLKNGYDRSTLPDLCNPAGQLARILREQERSGGKSCLPGR